MFLDLTEELAPKVIELTKSLASIPSPTGFESEKARYVQKWLFDRGIPSEIDEVGNVIHTMKSSVGKRTQLFLAHIDTVFAGVDTIEPKTENGWISAPSIGDNSCNAAALMVALEALHRSGRAPLDNRIIAFNVGEEGLGNLRGVRAILERFPNIDEAIAIDAERSAVINRGVGSLRYRVEVQTPGGHSYSAFGNESAIFHAAHIVSKLYDIKVPADPKTTYNAGIIEGGTSVNTIAQRCSVLIDLRSEDAGCLSDLNEKLQGILAAERSKDVSVGARLLGERPCGSVTDDRLLLRINAIRKTVGLPIACNAGSTDCNLPLSKGIPSVCFGVYRGRGAHTMEERIDSTSIGTGLRQLLLFFFDADVQP